MQALLLSEYNKLDLVGAPEPSIAADEVLLRVAACGICGSDVHGYDGSSGRRIPPIIMGHEAAGTIAAIGSAVSGWSVGQRVTFDSTLFCGRCFFCTRGEVNLCNDRQVFGVSCGDYRRNGAFAEYLAVPQRVLYALPDDLPFEQAAMIEAVSVALHAVAVSGFAAGETALVIGAGMIGTLIVQALRVAGLRRSRARALHVHGGNDRSGGILHQGGPRSLVVVDEIEASPRTCATSTRCSPRTATRCASATRASSRRSAPSATRAVSSPATRSARRRSTSARACSCPASTSGRTASRG